MLGSIRFIKHPNFLALPGNTAQVYCVLRAFSWNPKTNPRSKSLAQAVAAGFIACALDLDALKAKLAISDRTIRRSLLSLRDRGYLEIIHRVFILGRISEAGKVTFFLDEKPAISDVEKRPIWLDPSGESVPSFGQKRRRHSIGGKIHRFDPPVSSTGTTTETRKPLRRVRTSIPRSILPPNALTKAPPISHAATDPIEANAAPLPPASSHRLVDPTNPAREVDAADVRLLNSVLAKAASGRRGQLTGEEAVAAWRSSFVHAFGVEDLALRVAMQRKRAARLFTRRVTQWCAGSAETLTDFLSDMLRRWENRERYGIRTPTPSFFALLDEGPNGPRVFVNWRAERVRGDGGR